MSWAETNRPVAKSSSARATLSQNSSRVPSASGHGNDLHALPIAQKGHLIIGANAEDVTNDFRNGNLTRLRDGAHDCWHSPLLWLAAIDYIRRARRIVSDGDTLFSAAAIWRRRAGSSTLHWCAPTDPAARPHQLGLV